MGRNAIWTASARAGDLLHRFLIHFANLPESGSGFARLWQWPCQTLADALPESDISILTLFFVPHSIKRLSQERNISSRY